MTDDLQFDKAERVEPAPSGPVCSQCQRPITSHYYEVAGHVVCESCKRNIEAANVSGVAASSFARAVLFGVGGALAGAAVYYAVLAATGYEIGLIAILVGFMVGWAVRRGAGGLGGRRYQVLALTLTYLAIGGTYVPFAMRSLSDDPAEAVTGPALGEDGGATGGGVLSAVMGAGALILLAAALPILAGIGGLPSSLISLLIVGFALHQAWRMNGRLNLTFTGPFKVSGAGA